MSQNKRRGPFLDHLKIIEEKCEKEDLTLQNIFDILGPEGHFVLIAFLTMPFLQPIPLPGLSTPFGILSAVIAGLAYVGKPPWLPNRWATRKLPAKTILKIAAAADRIFEKLTFILRPRMKFFFAEPYRLVSTLLLITNALLLALPLPIPFSNALPAWMIVFQSLAYLEDDGLFILLSYLQSLICFIYFLYLYKGVAAGLEIFNVNYLNNFF